MIEGVGGLEAHVLLALDMGMPAENFGRIHHLPEHSSPPWSTGCAIAA